MYYVIIAIVIWFVVAFIYSKVKGKSFFSSLIKIPVIIIGVLFEMVASHRTDFSAAEKRARAEGRDDILNNIQERKQNEANMRNAATKNGTQFKAKSDEFLNKIDKK